MGTFLSQMTPVTSLHLFQASRTRFLQAVVVPTSVSNIDPRYVNVVTFWISSPSSSRIYSTGSALESEWAKKPGVDTFVILFPIAGPSGRDNPLEIYHIGYIFRTGR